MAGEKIQEAQAALDRLPLRPARQAGRDLPLPLQQLRRCCCRMDDGSPAAVARARPHRAERRHGDVRRRRRGDSARRAGPEPEEGAARDLGRQRHVERHERPRAQGSRFARPKCWSTRSASTATSEPTVSPPPPRAAAAPVRRPASVSRRARPRRRTPPIFRGSRHRRRRQRGGGRRGSPNDDRVNVVALRDMTDDSGGRTEIIRDARDLNPATAEHRRRAEQAVLPGLSVDREEGRPLARDPRRGAQQLGALRACAQRDSAD